MKNIKKDLKIIEATYPTLSEKLISIKIQDKDNNVFIGVLRMEQKQK